MPVGDSVGEETWRFSGCPLVTLAQGVCLSLTKPLMSLYVMVALETALLVADMIDVYCFTMLYISSVRFRYDQ